MASALRAIAGWGPDMRAPRGAPERPDVVRFRVFDASTDDGVAAWLGMWRAWPGREVMAHPEYARLFARPCDRVVCVAGDGGARGGILFPLVLRPLAAEPWAAAGEARWDAATPYGYGGPFAWGDRDEAGYWRAFSEWCREASLVSTFARLSLFPEQLATVPGRVEVRYPNIVVPLAGGPDALWGGYEPKVRKWVQAAEKAGLEVVVDREGARLDAFVAIYESTMRRRDADAWYFFPRSFFEAIVERLAGQFALFFTLSGGEPVSSDLVLCSEEHVYYFLGGTLAEAFPLGPNYLLKHRIASWAIAQGKRAYVLGGGYAAGDGLFRYKRAFARRGEVPFKIASWTHDERACTELAERRAAHARQGGITWAPRPEFFPAYRG
jgi:hypothetical protein